MVKILIVDDDPLLRNLLDIYLQKYKKNFFTVFAADGEEALKILAKEDISLLVTDIKMPKVDGLALLSHMKANHPAIPCIVLTSYNFPGLEKRLSKKIFHFFKKPVDPKKIVECILQGLEQTNNERALIGLSVAGLIQVIGSERKTCLLNIQADTKTLGLMYFCNGELYDAIYGELKGKEAAIKLIAMEDVQVFHKKAPRKKIFRRIKTGMQSLILEAMSLKDETAAKNTDRLQVELSQQRQSQLLKEGKILCKGLYLKEAQKPLLEMVKNHPNNVEGFLWLSRTVNNMDLLRKALTMASKIDAKNTDVKSDIRKYMAATKICGKQIRRCPFCYAPINLKTTQCHYCKSYLVINKEILERISEQASCHELRQAIERYEDVLSREVNDKILYYAGLAWLHLNKFDASLYFFEQLQSCVGNEECVYQQAVKGIVAHIASKKAEKKPAILTDPCKEYPVFNDISNIKKVLIVEDSPTTRRVIKMTLLANGFDVNEAADGIEALSKLNDVRPDLILLDVMLPKLDGYGILSVLKQNDDFKQIPVVMLTSKDSFKDKLKGRFSSASAYLTKPFKPEELIRQVNKYI